MSLTGVTTSPGTQTLAGVGTISGTLGPVILVDYATWPAGTYLLGPIPINGESALQVSCQVLNPDDWRAGTECRVQILLDGVAIHDTTMIGPVTRESEQDTGVSLNGRTGQATCVLTSTDVLRGALTFRGV